MKACREEKMMARSLVVEVMSSVGFAVAGWPSSTLQVGTKVRRYRHWSSAYCH